MIVAKTDKGKVRSSNQDAVMSGNLGNNAQWLVVCDGMGGANGGNVASTECVKIIEEQLRIAYRDNMSEESMRQLFETAIYNANTVVCGIAEENIELNGMGTTIVLAIIRDMQLYLAHVGDSRAMLIRNGELKRLTKDHTVVQSMIDAGELTEAEAKVNPNRHIITRVIGVTPSVQSDYMQMDIENEDILLLCSDGLYNCIEDEQIISILKNGSFEDRAEVLVEVANENGGDDNITVALFRADSAQEAE